MKVKFGLIPVANANRIFETVEETVLAEDEGFDSVWVGEHHGRKNHWPSPIVTLAHLAARTRKVKLGTGTAVVPFYHPVRLAEEIALLDVLSNGRAIVGVSGGYVEEEFAAFGLSRKERVARLLEGVALIRRLLGETSVSYEGRFFRVHNFTIWPRPVQKPWPEVWLGTGGPVLIRQSVDIVDRLYMGIGASSAQIAERIAIYKDALQQKGLHFSNDRIALNRIVFVTEDRGKKKQVETACAEMFASEYRKWSNPDVAANGWDDNPAKALEARIIVGDPDECFSKIRCLAEMGVGYLIAYMHVCSFESSVASIKMFGSHVLPRFS